MTRLALAVGIAAWLAVAAGAASPGAAAVKEEDVTRVASLLRCVVCQNLSVADSPSEMARQMRDVIRERLAQGETPDQVLAYFVDKYGQWILLSPSFRGFRLVVWVLPFAGLIVGVGVVTMVTRRWTRRPAEAPEPLGLVDRERLRVELERLRD